MQIVDNRGPTF